MISIIVSPKFNKENILSIHLKNKDIINFKDIKLCFSLVYSIESLEGAIIIKQVGRYYELQLKNTGVMMDSNDFKACLERLNRLVHIVEKGTHHKGYRNDFFVIRFNSDHVSSNFPKLTEEDYKLFQQNVENGELFSDFFTVGKDLGHAYHTGDVELITNKEVKQQSVVSGAVHFGFNRMHFGYKRESIFDSYPHYQAWCEHHRANDYGYNYWEPKYNLGRAPIGTLINETYETMLTLG